MFKKRVTVFIFLCLFFIPLGCSNNEQPKSSQANEIELMISAAASLTDVLNEIKSSFESEHDRITVTFNFGSSGKLAQQIEQGAPVDVFLSASKKDMERLKEKDLIVDESHVDFAENTLVLIANQETNLKIPSFEEIDPTEITHFAIGEPESVPVGRYTKEVLENVRLWKPLENKLVLSSDVRQVLTHVEMGNADIGVVYSSDAIISDKVKVLAKANPELHEPIVYPGAVLTDSEHPEEATAFLEYLTSDKGKEVFKKYGFK